MVLRTPWCLFFIAGHAAASDQLVRDAASEFAKENVEDDSLAFWQLQHMPISGELSTQGSSACACQNFAELYRSKKVKCGDGLEKTDEELLSHPDVEYCADFPGLPNSAFYPKQDHNMCVKVHKVKSGEPSPFPGMWCYVSAQCTELHGGEKVNSEASFKICQSKDDKMLSQLPPSELFSLVKKLDADAQMMALMAYKWEGPAEGTGDLTDMKLDADMTEPVVGASSMPDAFTVRWKNQVWRIHDDPECLDGC